MPWLSPRLVYVQTSIQLYILYEPFHKPEILNYEDSGHLRKGWTFYYVLRVCTKDRERCIKS